jgi:hypothetical protein
MWWACPTTDPVANWFDHPPNGYDDRPHDLDRSVAPVREIDIRQYSRARVLGVWAAAAFPTGVPAWVVAPAIASTGVSLVPALIGCLTAGLVCSSCWHCR